MAQGGQPDSSTGAPPAIVLASTPEYTSSTSADTIADPKSPGVVKRAMERTADKLSRGKSLLSQSQPALPQPGHRRMFSLTRGKGKERQVDGDLPTSQSQTLSSPPSSPPLSPRKQRRIPGLPGDDDSPFITPNSPSFGPSRPENLIFRGFRSMHAGTQTFIQALQAVPWAEDQDNDDEYMNHDLTPAETESDEDEGIVNRLTSSIHAIYRPLARFKRGDPSASLHRAAKAPGLPSLSDNEEVSRSDESPMSDEDTEGDFEPPVGGSIIGPSRSGRMSPEMIPDLDTSESDLVVASRERQASRAGSMATVRQNRRAQLAEKLQGVFELNNINEVVAELPCWLLRSVLLQGYMYLTDTYICFFAHLPSREDQVLKSGSLMKKAQRTKRWIRHWFILKNDVLSWYQSSSDPYFPHGVVDLRYAISCEPINEKDIRLRTNQKSIRLSADSVPSRDEWVKAIRRVMLKAQNMGDSIKIAIPYTTVVDVERSNAMDFSETIEIKVQDKSMDLALDSYFFAYFHDLPTALEQIRDAVRTYRSIPSTELSPMVVDTTAGRSSTTRPTPPTSSADSRPRSPPAFRLSSLLKPLQETLPIGRSASAPGVNDANNEDFTHVVRRSGSSFVPVATSLETTSPISEGEPSGRPASLRTSTSSLTPMPTPTISHHTYPPSVISSVTDIRGSTPVRESTSSSGWSVGMPSMPSWFRVPSRSLFGTPTHTARPSMEHAVTLPAGQSMPSVTEVVSSGASTSSHPTSSSRTSGDFGFFSILETPETTVDPDTMEKFRQAFAFDDKENLLGMFTGYLFRLLPIYGRLYVSNNYFCFKASGPLTSKTKMILPLRDVLATEKQKSFRFGHHGLVVIVKGHEELFFEFVDEDRRDAFVNVIQRQLENVRQRAKSGDTYPSSDSRHDALILEEFGPRHTLNMSESQLSASDSTPAYMFTSQSSTFLSFKPDRPLHFTFLTIGSRGDVQPYIALAKGLMADGHRVRIATHGEFREWVESHGIEFGYVGGDPAELMRICVENGTFTVAFLKEGVSKFRGWIDDLLKTSWEACQGTDVLIESPSAMGGFHIAEALKIPYFRAFTMTWSRTRAYPHAFAVPEHKMGGNYNYMTYVLFDQVFWRGTAGQINRWRRNTLKIPGTSLDKMEPHKIPFLYNFSPIVVPPPLDWPEWIRVTGYWFLDDADVSSKKWEPPKALVDFMQEARDAGKKIVYIGFGSIVVPDPKAMTRCVIDAIVQSGVYAILSKGWSDRLVKNAPAQTEPEEPLPKQIYPIASIPHDWLFKQIDAACHHGGAGTTGASLRAGIPTIIRPFFGDQFFWADRVEALGIGAAVRKLTVDSLAQALHEATTNQKLIERARLVGEQIRAENGVNIAIEAIYRDLEYARSLIKGGPSIRDTARDDYLDAEHATIRDYPFSSSPPEHPSPSWSATGPASDWSVISDSDEPSQESHEP